MKINGMQAFVSRLKAEGELLEISQKVSTELEITEIADRFVNAGGPALLFTNNGSPFPLLINAFATDRRMAMALGMRSLQEIESMFDFIHELKNIGNSGKFRAAMQALGLLRKAAAWMPVVKSGRGSCQQVIHRNPDLSLLPVMKCWPYDGGRFITLPMVHTKHPVDGTRNLGMYRMQVFGSDTCGMHWHKHKDGAAHYREAGKTRMPVSVCLGGDPVYTYCAGAPLPPGIDEYILAGMIRGRKVKMVRCITNDIEVPEDADFVIEGYIDTEEPLRTEGPFGDHTGFYSLTDEYPVFHVSCITHRKDAVYPSTIVGIPPKEDLWLGKTTEKLFLKPMQLSVAPEILDLYMPAEGVFHNIAIVKINKTYEGQAVKVMNALWGAGQMMFNKYLLVTDQYSGDIRNPQTIKELLASRLRIPGDLYFSHGPADALDHSGCRAFESGKAGIDLTGNPKTEIAAAETDLNSLMKKFPEVKAAGRVISWQEKTLVMQLCVHKAESAGISGLHKRICESGYCGSTMCIIYTDQDVTTDDTSLLLWLAANHSDPGRDIIFGQTAGWHSCIGVDATRKHEGEKHFSRPWPEPALMDTDTISRIDNRWASLTQMPFIKSPSLRYMSLKKSEGAEFKPQK